MADNTNGALEELRAQLRNPSGDENKLYRAILCLGKARYLAAKSEIEQFLTDERAQLRYIALNVLTLQWGCAEHRSTCERFIERDEDEDNRRMGVSGLGALLHGKRDARALELLLQLFKEEHEPRTVRDAAYAAILAVLGAPPSETPLVARPLNPADIDQDRIREAATVVADAALDERQGDSSGGANSRKPRKEPREVETSGAPREFAHLAAPPGAISISPPKALRGRPRAKQMHELETRDVRSRESARAQRCTVPLIGENDRGPFVWGTGTLFTIGSRHFLITAAHVARSIQRLELGLPIGQESAEVWTLSGKLVSAAAPQHDLAVLEFSDEFPIDRLKKSFEFLTLKDVNLCEFRPSQKKFFLLGYPRAMTRVEGDRIVGIPFSLRSSRYLGSYADADVRLDPRLNLLIIPPESASLANGAAMPVRGLGAISGSSVWLLKGNAWPSDFATTLQIPNVEMKVVGVQTHHRPGRWIRATNWVLVANILMRIEPAFRGPLNAVYRASREWHL